jgi:hypothetical protein
MPGSDGGTVRLPGPPATGAAFAPYLEITAFWITPDNYDFPQYWAFIRYARQKVPSRLRL